MSTTTERVQTPSSEADVSSEVLSSLINMAGRQRMLSQRIVLKAMLASQQFDGALAIARDTLRTFADNHAALMQGRDGFPGLFSPALREAFHGSDNVAKRIADFIALASMAIEAIERSSPRADEALRALIEAVDPLLTHLHGVTAVYEQESRRIARAQKKGQQDLIDRIKAIAKEAHIVSFNGQIVASRANVTGREFAVVAGVMTSITRELEAAVSAFVKKTSAG
ncbi:type IV pili methyl-accepting chemotaxis transducer N-terminal domain-containing protein [Paraburkholderia sp. SIMBA_030]|uniref:type IV pili methyl-accepting chemotaxis transducer N-terminal domain-containing protein n=1 Tax=Paraburkholderia sp. SIMBA_030 TaxID=3085773 RepID=UPI00397DFAF2